MLNNAQRTNSFPSLLDDRHSSAHRYTLFAILAGALLLRWYALYAGHGYMYFAIRDEVHALKSALDFLTGDTRTYYLGQPALNQGNIPGPLWSMFVALIYKLGASSTKGMLYITLLINSAVIYPAYCLALKMMPARYALLSALFYALAPWAIYYTSGIYNPMLLGMLGSLLFLALWQTLERQESRAIFWVMLLAAAIPQFHMIGIFYYPAILLLLFYSPTRLNRRWLLAGVIAGVILYVPYLIGEILHHWSNLRHVLMGNGKFSAGVLKIISIPVAMLTNQPGRWSGFHIAESISYGNKWFGSYIVLLVINVVSLILALVFMVTFVKRYYKALRSCSFRYKTALAQHPVPVFLGTLIIIPLVCYLPTGKDYATRYCILIFPLIFLLPALYFANCNNQRWKHIFSYTLSIMLLCNIYIVVSFYTDLNRQLHSGPMFMPAFYKLHQLKQVLEKNAGGINNILLDTSQFHTKDKRYDAISMTAIKTYITAYQDYRGASASPVHRQRYILASSLKNVPTNGNPVYKTNGLVVYTISLK